MKDLAYYLTLYKLEGHTTWRASLATDKNDLDNQRAQQMKTGQKFPNITDRITYRIDRLTGTIE